MYLMNEGFKLESDRVGNSVFSNHVSLYSRHLADLNETYWLNFLTGFLLKPQKSHKNNQKLFPTFTPHPAERPRLFKSFFPCHKST